jgi:hypothetical protein
MAMDPKAMEGVTASIHDSSALVRMWDEVLRVRFCRRECMLREGDTEKGREGREAWEGAVIGRAGGKRRETEMCM